jgi:arginine/lysine/ornithine decarboxylase
VLSSVCAVCKRGDNILIARNSHISAYNAVAISGANPTYIHDTSPETIETELHKHKYSAVFITSPTYTGDVSDISKIADICHNHGALLIVDEAHGAHFIAHERFPASAVTQYADITVQSLHKTLPVPNAGALIHTTGNLSAHVKQFINIFQTTSPSYYIMAMIDKCVEVLNNKILFDDYINKIERIRSLPLKNIKIKETDDISRLVFTNINGHILEERMRNCYNIQLEMSTKLYALCITSVADTDEGFERLGNALLALDNELIPYTQSEKTQAITPTIILQPWECLQRKDTVSVKLIDSLNRICAEHIILYPPGIPIVAKGELITNELIDIMKHKNMKTEVLCYA